MSFDSRTAAPGSNNDLSLPRRTTVKRPLATSRVLTYLWSFALIAFAIIAAPDMALAQDTPESKFLIDAVRGDLAEVKLGELAEQKGQSEGVREFGTMLVR